jgi:hypothetical protein
MRQSQKEAEKKFIKDGLVCWLPCLCNFFEQSFGGLVCWHAAIDLQSIFSGRDFKKNKRDSEAALLPQALLLTDWKETA